MTAVALVARVCLVVLFPLSGIDKIVHWGTAMKQAASAPIGGARFMLIAAIVVELSTPVCIVVGWHAVIAALLLAAFCLVTALLFHPFWHFPGFWSGANPEGTAHFWDFLKNIGLAGGLLLVVVMSASAAPRSEAPHATASLSQTTVTTKWIMHRTP